MPVVAPPATSNGPFSTRPCPRLLQSCCSQVAGAGEGEHGHRCRCSSSVDRGALPVGVDNAARWNKTWVEFYKTGICSATIRYSLLRNRHFLSCSRCYLPRTFIPLFTTHHDGPPSFPGACSNTNGSTHAFLASSHASRSTLRCAIKSIAYSPGSQLGACSVLHVWLGEGLLRFFFRVFAPYHASRSFPFPTRFIVSLACIARPAQAGRVASAVALVSVRPSPAVRHVRQPLFDRYQRGIRPPRQGTMAPR